MVKNVNVKFNALKIYTTLYHAYKVLYCKGHIQMITNHSTIDVEIKPLKLLVKC